MISASKPLKNLCLYGATSKLAKRRRFGRIEPTPFGKFDTGPAGDGAHRPLLASCLSVTAAQPADPTHLRHPSRLRKVFQRLAGLVFALLFAWPLCAQEKEDEAPPFDAALRDGRIYGRGAADMKGSCATMMVLMKDLGSFPLEKPSLGLILTTDEEIGGYDGVRYLLRDKKYSCR